MAEKTTTLTDTGALREILVRVSRIEDRLNAVLFSRPPPAATSEKVRRAVAAREEAKALGYFTVKLFAAVIGRNCHWVSDRCRIRSIKVLPGGKPYRIPFTEEARFNGRLFAEN